MRKTAIVTGASRGLGRGTALILAREGNYRVYATARNGDALNKLKDEVGSVGCEGEVIPCIIDQNSDDEVIELTKHILSKEPKIDLLVNSAYEGLIAMTPHFGKPFWERPISVYDGHMDVGVRSSYVMSKLIVPKMIENNDGLIIQISSAGGYLYFCDVGYGVSHAAMDRLTLDMATELKNYNVKAITLHPGGAQTEIASFPDGESPQYVGRSILAICENANDHFLTKANGKTLLTAELANKFGFKEDYDKDGSVNKVRLEATKFFKETMNRPLTQYDLEAPLPDYTDSNNEGFANFFPGAKQKPQNKR